MTGAALPPVGIYERLGVTPVINAWGTVTALGGSLMRPPVLVAMIEASQSFVDLTVFQRAAAESIAHLLGVEAACITSGAAAGLTIAAAACMAGADSALGRQLPETRGMRSECLILRGHRSVYDQAVRVSGMRIREVGATTGDIRSALSADTAMFLYLAESESDDQSLPLAEVSAALGGSDVPLVVDAAAELPPLDTIARQFASGADLVAISGGKGLRGPQDSGLLLGNSRIVECCAALAFPNHGIGRGMKISKETIAGLVAAVELYVTTDEATAFAGWTAMADRIVNEVGTIARAAARRGQPTTAGIQPASIPRAYVRVTGLSSSDLRDRLRQRTPSIAVGIDGNEIVVNPQCLQPGETDIVIAAISEVAAMPTSIRDRSSDPA